VSRIDRRITLGLVALATACEAAPPTPRDAAESTAIDPVAPLRSLETALRAGAAAQAPPERTTGANPVDVARLGDALVGVLAGDDAVVLLDGDARELARLPGPSGSRTVAVAGDRAYVAGATPLVARYRRRGTALVADGAIRFPGAAIAALTVHAGGAVYAADAVDGTVRAAIGDDVVELALCRGAARAVAAASAVAFACVLDHSALVIPVDAAGRPRAAPVRVTLDGPVWTVALDGGGDLLAIGGAEDHPLDRSQGFFGHIDSFAYLYRVGDAGAVRVASIDLGDHGLAVPRWIDVGTAGGDAVVETAGYASDTLLSIRIPLDAAAPATIERQPLVPGVQRIAALGARRIAADPLLDAWVILDGGSVSVVPARARRAWEPSPAVRLGELLFFTTLLAPGATSAGAHSVFTCETCHWEGYGDGRVHYTGRRDVHATTRPLRGLAQGRPYFSRANDRTMVDMVHAEFGVAARGTDRSPWFTADAPWLVHVPNLPTDLSPLALRAALMEFLTAFGHEANPAVGTRTRFSDAERRGAEVFRDRCESCHQARLLVDDETTRQPFAAWERHIMSPDGPITWAADHRVQTGVTPYVHADGARIPALRRLYRKHPYFTNGSATSLADLLDRVRTGASPDELRHDGPSGTPLPPIERTALLAFLRLL
jgi:hypothetical protein